MQNLRLPFFCHLSSLSFLGRFDLSGLPGIQWCLLVRSGPHRRRDGRAPVVATRRGGGAVGLGHAGSGPLQAGTEVVGLDLDDGALLALLVLPGALLEAPGDHHARPPRERLGRVLGQGTPAVDREERRFAVGPVARGVADPRRVRDAEVRDRRPVGRVPQLRVVRQDADDGDLVIARHGAFPLLSSLTPRLRRGKLLPFPSPSRAGASPCGGSPPPRSFRGGRGPVWARAPPWTPPPRGTPPPSPAPPRR